MRAGRKAASTDASSATSRTGGDSGRHDSAAARFAALKSTGFYQRDSIDGGILDAQFKHKILSAVGFSTLNSSGTRTRTCAHMLFLWREMLGEYPKASRRRRGSDRRP